MTQAGGSSSGLTGLEELTEFQGRAFLALTDMPPSMEEIDLLLPLASIPGPNLSPRQHCCVQQHATTSLMLASAGEQPGSSALLPSSQKPLTSLALLPRPPKPWSWGQPCWQLWSKPPASSRLAPSSTSAQPPRAAGAGTGDAKCNRGSEGTAQVLGLGSNSCRICQQGHLPSSSSSSHNPHPAAGQPGHSSAPHQHPGDTAGTQGPPSPRGAREEEGGK